MKKFETRIPFFLMWKYLHRGNKWTLFLIIFLMAIAFINLVFVTSLFNGIIKSSEDQIINTYTGHIMITPKIGSDYIEEAEHKTKIINEIENIAGVSDQISIPGSLEYKGIKGNWTILAIDPEKEKTVTNVHEKMISGEYLNSHDTDKIIIGRQIAGGEEVEMNAFSFKGVSVGEKVTLNLGEITKEFEIQGIFYTKFINTDQRAFITKKAWQELNPEADNKATSIIVRLDKRDGQTAISKMKEKGINENFLTWENVSGLMDTVTSSFLSINILLTLVGTLIAAVTIFIVIYIDITNKKRQIGILRAIGIKPYIIRSAYVIQTSIYSVSGVLLGTALFFGILVPYFKAFPFELPIGDATLVVNPADYIFRLETIILVAIGSGLIPVFMVTRMKILDAIWGRN
ncbi:MAG: FtsX-like permease family protein [Patescibacteria group bacterium]|nr:FtsX-like permease family protein [Patescibacteria group bacterium]